MEQTKLLSAYVSKTRYWLLAAVGLGLIGLVVASSLPSVAADPAAKSGKQAASYAKSLSNAFREAADQVLPSVVMIRTRPALAERSSDDKPNLNDSFEGSPFGDLFQSPEFRRFFRDMPNMPQMPRGQRRGVAGLGSGVIIDPSGLILTNNHVVDGGGKIVVRLHDGREFEAVEVKQDPKTDLAVVRIEGAKNLKAAKLGDSDSMGVGDWVLALGDPFGLEGTVTAGIISAKGRGLGITHREDFIQTDAAINPGNSGGPLVNLDGEVVGINTAISSRTGGYQGVGFAVPVNLAKWVSSQLVDKGTVRRAYLGVVIQPVSYELAEQFGVEVREGVVVSEVRSGTPAAKAGLEPGDVIVEFNGQPVASPRELQGLVEKAPIDKKQPMLIVRDGKRKKMSVVVREQPAEFGLAMNSSDATTPSEATHFEKFGLQVEKLTKDVAEKLGLKTDEGVVITEVKPGSLADMAGLDSGNVIVGANRKPVKSVADLKEAINEKSLDEGVLLLIRTADGSRFVVLRTEG